MSSFPIQSALISVYHKDGLDELVQLLHKHQVKIYSTGGTATFIASMGIPVVEVESITGYPSIFGGRVKTLHPAVMGGILYRRNQTSDETERVRYSIPSIDMVVVDLYPFEQTVHEGRSEDEIIEKIDIGGISLIRAAAKNFAHVFILSHRNQYREAIELLKNNSCKTQLNDRKKFAKRAFDTTSHYDAAIYSYFANDEDVPSLKVSENNYMTLRYGENPHQKGIFYGNLNEYFEKISGKELSFNNLLDTDAAVALIQEFQNPTFAIIKHNNACGIAEGRNIAEAYEKALAADPVSAFGGVLISNHIIDRTAAEKINVLFFEILIAPEFTDDALSILKEKKNRILLKQKEKVPYHNAIRSTLGGFLSQQYDWKTDQIADFTYPTKLHPNVNEKEDLIFASIICKHSKSNTIILVKNKQLLASGVGQTSRVDALEQAINKAIKFGFDLRGAVMASDAFFPFPDCVEIAEKVGIHAVIQPGGSIKDQLSIDFCDQHHMSMVFTGFRHFKH